MPGEMVTRPRLRRMAARWHDSSSGGHTYLLSPGSTSQFHLPEDVAALLAESDTGGILFSSLSESHLVVPPFPVTRNEDFSGWNSGPLQSLLDKPRTILVVLVRLGGFAVGIFEGERLASSKVDAPFVKGRHRAGGSSSGRFARRHDNQARDLFGKVCEVLREQVETYAKPPQHLVLGGDRLTLQGFEKRCGYLSRFQSVRLKRILVGLPDPRLEVLRQLPRLLYASQVHTFQGMAPGPAIVQRGRHLD